MQYALKFKIKSTEEPEHSEKKNYFIIISKLIKFETENVRAWISEFNIMFMFLL